MEKFASYGQQAVTSDARWVKIRASMSPVTATSTRHLPLTYVTRNNIVPALLSNDDGRSMPERS